MPAEFSAALTADPPAPVYLLLGEPFDTEAAARALIDRLVPAAKRSFNLEQVDGRSAAIGAVLDSLLTPSLFGGTKVVWVREPTWFLSGEKRGDVTDALFAAVDDGRRAEAAEKLLLLAAAAGWSQADFAGADFAAMTANAQSTLFGRPLERRELDAVEGLRALAAERGVSVGAFRDESSALERYLATPPPPGAVLLCTASAVDRRKKVVKTIQQRGALIELTVARERSGALGAESVEALSARIVGAAGKKLTPPARQLLHRRAGTEPGSLASELEKLVLYVGDTATIDEPAVRASLRDLGESWIFDFTKALAQRQAGPALTLLRGLFAQGEHPLRLLAIIARELRLLLLAHDCLSGSLAGVWSARTTYAAFRDRLLPRLSEEERDAIGSVHPFVLYQCLQNAGRVPFGDLQRGILALQALDVAFKSTPTDPRLRLEAFVLEFCGAGQDRARPT